MRASLRDKSGPTRCRAPDCARHLGRREERRGIGSAARDIFIDRLANARFQLSEVARQINHDVALLSVHRIELNAKFSSGMVHSTAAISSHASHTSMQKVIAEKRSTFNVQRWLEAKRKPAALKRQPSIRYARV